MIGETRENWMAFLHGDDCRFFLVLVEEEPLRQAYALYREGRVLEAARGLYEAVPDMAWRARGVPLREDQVVNERPGEAFIFLRGEPYEADKMPVGVLSGIGWDHEGRAEFHYTLVVDEELLETEPIEGLPEPEEVPE